MKDRSAVSILTVDDSEEDLKLNRLILESEGFAVACAANLKEARTMLAARPYGVLLVDLRLPDGSGLDLLEDARKRDPHAVAVVLTGFSSAANAVSALKAGAYDFLTKPCPAGKLQAALHRAVERYALASALSERNKQLEAANRSLDHRVQDATHEIFALNERLKRTIGELQAVNRAQTQTLEEVAHELKNPLSVIWGYSSFWLHRPAEEYKYSDLKRTFENVHRNAQHLQALIDDLLDSARLESKKMTLHREMLDGCEIAADAAECHHLRAKEKGIELRSECVEGPKPRAFADRNRLRQILGNLITNAIKFTPSGGRITLSCRHVDGGGAHFTVEDTGRGIPQADVDKIFKRFFQVQDADAGNKGLGLGLSIVDGLVRLHGGRIWVDSEWGKGSRFHVVLPDNPSESIDEPGEEPAALHSN